jgi:hypothetical protein
VRGGCRLFPSNSIEGFMRITTLISALAVGAALIFIVYTFMIEGFQTAEQTARINSYLSDAATNRMTTTFGVNADTICKKHGDGSTGDCAACLDADGTNHPGTECGYWPQGNACIPRSGIYRIVPDWLIEKQNLDNSYPQVFDPRNFVYNVGKCGGAACASFTSCKTCASAAACGWCDSNEKCMDRAAVTENHNKIISEGSRGSAGSAPQPLCPPKEGRITSANMITDPSSKSHLELIQEVGTCRPETCADKATCFECTTTPGCGFCRTTGKCIKVDSGGNHDASQLGGSTGSRGSDVCPTGKISLQPYMCPCSGMSDCKTCATQPGCGWCVAGKNCVNVDLLSAAGDTQNMIGGVNTRDCATGVNGVATSALQCTPGAKLGNVRSEMGNYKPSDEELSLTQDNSVMFDRLRSVDITGSVGGGVIGSRPVSTAKTTTQVTGNGVVVPKQGGPYEITNQPGLFTSPFEEYVKVLIKSELVAGGVPINEPFQDSPNIVNYLKKEVNKAVRKNF